MIITYKKILYEDLPPVVHRAIVEFTRDSIIIDDTSLTANQKSRLDDWMISNGYKLQ